MYSSRVMLYLTDCPTDTNLSHYVRALEQLQVTNVVRLCEPAYATLPLTRRGIAVHDMAFQNGQVPPSATIARWYALLHLCEQSSEHGQVIGVAVHGLAGIGRGPLMICLGLMLAGATAEEAIDQVRTQRPAALNTLQTSFLHAMPVKRQPAKLFSRHWFWRVPLQLVRQEASSF